LSLTLATPAASPERAAGPVHLGFLTVVHEAGGYLGGYLVTNLWGRPLEFRLSSAVQPSRIQQILYAATLQPYVCADLIGRTLVEKTSTPVGLVITDREPVLDLRLKLDTPVVWLAPADMPRDPHAVLIPRATPAHSHVPLLCHPRFATDAEPVGALLDRLDLAFDLAEPFTRIREAMGEARRLGPMNGRG